MGKLLVLLCFALIAMTVVMACTPPGAPCTSDSDCCASFVCNPWAGRCTGGPGGPGGPGGRWGPRT
ncbi:uncharacterized protein LOC109610698 [Ooceraea biroi]|uniref:Uncharacterized protein n=1 Tax=Ooceraea biroi TaxID=2015173 RepID=A0A026WW26_OOCBI|nr:uncharacterized protein LOC109610698 [Ooceraea biroi]EZA59906.1 hypothetical protein X777_16109 [Ooceraea biroi]